LRMLVSDSKIALNVDLRAAMTENIEPIRAAKSYVIGTR